MTIYQQLASQAATPTASDLAARLSAWHDAMVRHERTQRISRNRCGDDCPHADAPLLWAEALDAFGDQALSLTFLRSRSRASGDGTRAGSHGGRREQSWAR